MKLPERVHPELSPWSPTGEIVRYVLEGPGYTTSQLKAIQDWVVNRALKQVPGVIDVVGFGGTIKQYQVLVDTRLALQVRPDVVAGGGSDRPVQRERRGRSAHPGDPDAHRPGGGAARRRGRSRSTRRT